MSRDLRLIIHPNGRQEVIAMQTSDTEPRRAVNGDETDAYSWLGRRYLAALRRAGVRSKTKRRTRRRERRERRDDARRQRYGGLD